MSFEIEQLQSICKKIVSGGTPKSTNPDFYNNGTIPWVKTKEVNNNRIHVSENYITELGLKSSSAKIIPANSVIIAMYGNGDTAGRVAINKIPVSTNQACCNLIIDNSKADYRYVFYFLRTQYQRLVDLKNGGAQQNLNAKTIKEYPFPCAPLQFQNVVADILEGLDEKIILNQCINQTLEQMAQALFKSWFVDFEPVKAKITALEAGGSQEDATLAAMTAISGKDADALAVFEREHPEQYAELKATAELFPSAMKDSDQGCIPEGWEYRKIGDYIDNISKTYPLKKVEQVVFLNTGDIKEGVFLHENKSDVGSLPGQAKKSIKEGDILYSEIRPINKRFAFVYFKADEYVVSTKLMVLRPKSKELSYYLYFLLSSNEVVSYLQLMAESRSGTFPQITYDTVSDIKILTSPDELVIKSFCKLLGESLYIPQQSIIKQNDMLTNIRDTLLPKLLSGEITLPEAEQVVSEAENV